MRIEEIKEKVDIVEVISEYLSLKKAGQNYKGLCPFHPEKTPSFMVNQEKQVFHCFGCAVGGNVFTFLMRINNFSFHESVQFLAKKFGFTIDWAKGSGEKEIFYRINQLATEYFHSNLFRDSSAYVYLKGRGIKEDTITENKLGYAEDRWDGLVNFLQQKEIPLAYAQRLGLIFPKKTEGFYDYFRNRIIFPISDLSDRVVGFGSRCLDDSPPKYLNSLDSIIYSKGQNLYGLNLAKNFIREKDFILVVEGYFDFLSLFQEGIKNVVATLGTSLTQEHLATMKRFTDNITMVYDGDEAGKKALKRLIPSFLKEGIMAEIIPLPQGDDPDSLIRKKDKEEFTEELVKERKPLMDFFLEETCKGYDLSSDRGRIEAIRELIPILSGSGDPILLDIYIKKVAEKTGISEAALAKAIYKSSNKAKDFIDLPTRNGVSGYDEKEEAIILLILEAPSLFSEHVEKELEGLVEDPLNREIIGLLMDWYKNYGSIDLASIISIAPYERMKNKLTALFFERGKLFQENHLHKEKHKVLEDCIKSLRKIRQRKSIQEIQSLIVKAEKNKDQELLRELLAKRLRLTKSV